MEARHLQIMSLDEFKKIEQDSRFKYEFIEGKLYMQAAPNYVHQRIQQVLSSELYIFLKGKECQAITDAELGIDDEVVIPDIMVYCDKSFSGQTYEGVPIVVIEILSDSTRFVDYNKKMKLYEKHGVSEYWIINPKLKSLSIYYFGKSKMIDYTIGEMVASDNLFGFNLDVSMLFD